MADDIGAARELLFQKFATLLEAFCPDPLPVSVERTVSVTKCNVRVGSQYPQAFFEERRLDQRAAIKPAEVITRGLGHGSIKCGSDRRHWASCDCDSRIFSGHRF